MFFNLIKFNLQKPLFYNNKNKTNIRNNILNHIILKKITVKSFLRFYTKIYQFFKIFNNLRNPIVS